MEQTRTWFDLLDFYGSRLLVTSLEIDNFTNRDGISEISLRSFSTPLEISYKNDEVFKYSVCGSYEPNNLSDRGHYKFLHFGLLIEGEFKICNVLCKFLLVEWSSENEFFISFGSYRYITNIICGQCDESLIRDGIRKPFLFGQLSSQDYEKFQKFTKDFFTIEQLENFKNTQNLKLTTSLYDLLTFLINRKAMFLNLADCMLTSLIIYEYLSGHSTIVDNIKLFYKKK
jgi:hypothetical protein